MEAVEIPDLPPVKVKVRLVTFDTYDGNKYLVRTVSSPIKAYFVDKDLLKFSAKDQFVDLNILENATPVYSFEKELSEILTPIEDIVIALWSGGYFSPTDNLRALVQQLFKRGILPIKK